MSEVAKFREKQMEAEQSANLGLTGVASVARHAFISARMEGIWSKVDALLLYKHTREALEMFDRSVDEMEAEIEEYNRQANAQQEESSDRYIHYE